MKGTPYEKDYRIVRHYLSTKSKRFRNTRVLRDTAKAFGVALKTVQNAIHRVEAHHGVRIIGNMDFDIAQYMTMATGHPTVNVRVDPIDPKDMLGVPAWQDASFFPPEGDAKAQKAVTAMLTDPDPHGVGYNRKDHAIAMAS